MNPADLAHQTVDALIAYLPAAAEVGLHIGEGAAAHTLYELVATRLRHRGESDAVAAFTANPLDDSLMRRLVAQAIAADDRFRSSVLETLRTMPATTDAATVNQVGNVAGGNIAGRDSIRYNDHRVTHHKKYTGAGLLAIIIIIVVTGGVLIAKALLSATGSLTADSTCAEFLQATPSEELAAIRQIGLEKNVPSIGSPLALPEISYECSASPETPLGTVVARFRG